jgi:hypothetical protein
MTAQRYAITYRINGSTLGPKVVWGRSYHNAIRIICKLSLQNISFIEVYDSKNDERIAIAFREDDA